MYSKLAKNLENFESIFEIFVNVEFVSVTIRFRLWPHLQAYQTTPLFTASRGNFASVARL